MSNKGCSAGGNYPDAGWLKGWQWLAFVLAVLGMAPAMAQAQVSETVLHNFAAYPLKGVYPSFGVLFRDSAGSFYGTAGGGIAGYGVVYKLDTTGRESVLHSFTGGADGGNPLAGVVGDSAGNLYGTAYEGGSTFGDQGNGVVYKLDATGHETVLHAFEGGDDGRLPNALTLDSAGNLYGTTCCGGPNNFGVVFKAGAAGHYTVLHRFTGGAGGSSPGAGVIVDAAGNLYGTAQRGGPGTCADRGGCALIYRLDPAGNYTVLYGFTGGADGAGPASAVMLDPDGNLYGTAQGGGTGDCEVGNLTGCGVVYKLDSSGNYTVLHYFAAASGSGPSAGVIADPAGNLYGTTAAGGNLSACGGYGCGVVYKLDAAGNYTVLHTFTGGADGAGSLYSLPGVIRDSAGNLYGTTEYGGTSVENGGQGGGVVYKLDAAGQETVLFNFPSLPAGGYSPQGGMAGDAAGNFYGATYAGGLGNCADGLGCGVLYKLDVAGNYTVLHSFTGGGDGGSPAGGLARDSAQNLYGTTSGAVYKLDSAGNFTVLHVFTSGADGGGTVAGVIRDSAGNLYGTFIGGESSALGGVYKLDAAGNYTVLYTFTGGHDGGRPFTGVIRDSAGNLYGTTTLGGVRAGYNGFGVTYKLNAAGHYTVLHTFTGGADGGSPNAVIGDSAGNLYGTTYSGGAANAGVVYKLDAAGNYTVLHSFTGGADGARPQAGVIQDPAGNLYGTSTISTEFQGLVYKLDTAGNFSVLYTFTGGADGSVPSSLVRGPAGNVIGTASGGRFGGGVVFALAGVQ